MKKKIFTFLLIALVNTFGFGQSNYNLGLSLGPNYTSFRGSDSLLEKTNSDFGFSGGVFLEYKINKRFAVSSGLNFESKSIIYKANFSDFYLNEQTYEYVNENWNIKTTNKYKYFTVPLLFKYSFGNTKTFFVKGGGFISFLQNHKKKTRAVNDRGQVFENYSSNSSDNNFPLADKVEGDYGISFGFGKKFQLDKHNAISVELRDNLGLHNVLDGIMSYGQSGVIKTNTLNLIASWSFNL